MMDLWADLTDSQVALLLGGAALLLLVIAILVFRKRDHLKFGAPGVTFETNGGSSARSGREALRGGVSLWLPWRTRRQKTFVAEAALRLGRNPSVLWVDDHPSNNRYERNALKRIGIRVEQTISSCDALHELTMGQRPYDAVITDMGRGDRTTAGYELIRLMRATGQPQPVIVYSARFKKGNGYDEAVAKGALGATGSPEALFRSITQAIEQSIPAPAVTQ